MRQNRAENGKFTSKYSILGDTVVMRVPRICQKQIKQLLAELDSLPDSIDPSDILSELVEGLSNRVESFISE